MESRAAALSRLAAAHECDVLIVGGGINGAAVFRDAALQGLTCVLIDAEDFGSGASNASTRMAHGGLRYLETGQFRLVSESTRERDRLLSIARHYTTPLEITIPLFSFVGGLATTLGRLFGREGSIRRRGYLIVRAGLAIYDVLSRRSSALPRHGARGGARARRRFAGLHPGSIGTLVYYDCLVSHPERVAVELVCDGLRASPSSIAVNHCRLEGVQDGDPVMRDLMGGGTFRISAPLIINAGGAWIDEINALLGCPSAYIQGTKGSHLLIDNADLLASLDGSAFLWDDGHGRMCVMYPIADRVLLGSTDIRVDHPESAVCDEDEVRYLLSAVRLIFPWCELRDADIRFRYCGVRPLANSKARNTVNISRDHLIARNAPGQERSFEIMSLIGGKWTTFRAFAEEATDEILKALRRTRVAGTEDLAIGGAAELPAEDSGRRDLASGIAERSGLPPARALELLRRYGTRAADIAAFCAAGQDAPLSGAEAYSRREIGWLARNEMAVCLEDVFFRRTILALSDLVSEPTVRAVADILDEHLERSAEESRHDLERFEGTLATRHGIRLELSPQSRADRQTLQKAAGS